MSYQPSSKVLFLTNCSLTKAGGGSAEYDESQAITSALPDPLGARLLERRASVFQLVKNDTNFDWQGTPVSELEFNRELSRGKDLGGRHDAVYLPALDRYEGRFFQALSTAGKRKLVESGHHTLFLSGLYGLLRPTEPIQLYSCPLSSQVADRWREGALLTDVLCEYIRRFEITRIIDLTAIDAYRQLIDWEKVAATRTDVLHCFDVMAAGDYALTSFGKCLAEELLDLTGDEIADLPFGHRLGTVILRSPGEIETPAVAMQPRPRPERTVEMLTIRRELDGRIRGFGSRFWSTVENHCHPLRDQLENGGPLREVSYSDRYIATPWVLLLLREVLLDLVRSERANPGTALRVSTWDLRPDARRIRDGRSISDSWQDDDARELFFMEAFGVGRDHLQWEGGLELETGPAPHFRELRLDWADGVAWSLMLDQGVDYWRCSRPSADFPFDGTPREQIQPFNQVAMRYRVVPRSIHPTYIYVASA